MTEQRVIWWKIQFKSAAQLLVWVFAVLYGINGFGAMQLSFLSPSVLLCIGLVMIGVAFAVGSLAKKEKWKPAVLLIIIATIIPGVALFLYKDQPLLGPLTTTKRP